MKNINWEEFFGNSSTSEALIDFANGKTNFEQLKKDCWHAKECRPLVAELRRRGYKKALRSIKTELNKWYDDWKDDCIC